MTQSKDDVLTCSFCGKELTTERRLANHSCEQKRRHLQRDDKAVQLGYTAYKEFYQRSMGRKKPPSYESFAKSDLYKVFVAFGKHVVNIRAIKPLTFIQFLLRHEVKVDHWTRHSHYITYVCELTRTEDPLDAIERNFDIMKEWALEHPPENWQDFFRRVEPTLAVLWITSGRLSPWLLFTAVSAEQLMSRLSAEQTRKVYSVIDAHFWELKLERHKDEVERIRAILDTEDI